MSHARLSPSSAKRWMTCAAAPNREATLPDSDSVASMQGSNGHAYLEEMVLTNNVNAIPGVLPHPEAGCPQDIIDMAAQCFNYAQRRCRELKLPTLHAESKVSPQTFTGRDDGDGTADIVIVSQHVLEVIDLKTGGTFVDENDPQLKIYGLGVLAQHVDPRKGLYPFETVRLTVFQPKRPGKDTIERWIELTPAELLEWCEAEYKPRASLTDDPNAVGTPSDAACHFCKAAKAGTCPDLQAAMQQQAEALFMNTTPGPGTDVLMLGKAIDDMTPEELAALLDVAPMFKARFKDAEARVEALLMDRNPVPGYKLVRGNSRRGWALPQEELEQKFKELRLKADQYAPRMLLTPPALQKLGLPAKKWQQIEALIEVKAGGLTLAQATDPREDAMPTDLFQPTTPVDPAALFPPAQPATAPAAPMDLGAFGL